MDKLFNTSFILSCGKHWLLSDIVVYSIGLLLSIVINQFIIGFLIGMGCSWVLYLNKDNYINKKQEIYE